MWSDVTGVHASLDGSCRAFGCGARMCVLRIVISRGNSLGAEICGFGKMIDMTEMLVDKFMSKCVCSPMHDVLSEKSNSTPRIAMEGVLKLGCAMFFC